MRENTELLSRDSTAPSLSLPQADAARALGVIPGRHAVFPIYEFDGGSTKAAKVTYLLRVLEPALGYSTGGLPALAEAANTWAFSVGIAAKFPSNDDTVLSSARHGSREVSQAVASPFDAKDNLYRVVQSILGGDEQNQELLDAAAGALERLRTRGGESADEWAESLAPTFFADLDRLD